MATVLSGPDWARTSLTVWLVWDKGIGYGSNDPGLQSSGPASRGSGPDRERPKSPFLLYMASVWSGHIWARSSLTAWLVWDYRMGSEKQTHGLRCSVPTIPGMCPDPECPKSPFLLYMATVWSGHIWARSSLTAWLVWDYRVRSGK